MLLMLKLIKWRLLGRLKMNIMIYIKKCFIEYFFIFICLVKIFSYIRVYSKNSVVNVCRV